MKTRYLPYLMMALTLSACQEDQIGQDTPAATGEMTFNILTPGARTRVSDNAFEASDRIGLYVTDYADDLTPMPLQVSGNRANNVAVDFDGAAWTPEKTVYWGTAKSDVYAYYPYISEVSDTESQYFAVSADQTSDGYEASDLLWAKAEGVRQTDGAVDLQMQHIMSKLTVKIVAGEKYVGSLPSDASVLLHSTVTGARVDFSRGCVSKDPYSGAQTIKMKNLGVRTFDGVEAVVYEAIVVPQMLESSVPLLEINSKSVSYLLEDMFNFRPGVAYTYTATLNTSTTAIKVDIGCELEDWNSTGGSGSGEGGSGDQPGEGDDADLSAYTDLSASGTANCYLVQKAGDYRFNAVLGNTEGTVGNVKGVEVLWESFGTDVMPNVGDLVASVSYSNGYICFSTPETFRNGNAVIAAKSAKGSILWSWHIWCSAEGWKEQVYYNDAGTMMDRNLGATSATPGDVGALGLMYQWGRKDPFMGSSSISSSSLAASTGTWEILSNGNQGLAETNPMVFYKDMYLPNGSWQSEKTAYDPCPAGWRVPDGGEEGVWAKALGSSAQFTESQLFNSTNCGNNFSGKFGDDEMIWYPASGCRYYSSGTLVYVGSSGYCGSCSPNPSNGYLAYYLYFGCNGDVRPSKYDNRAYGYPVRCLQE